MQVQKRDNRLVDFNSSKIKTAIQECCKRIQKDYHDETLKVKEHLTEIVDNVCLHLPKNDIVKVEEIQDTVEQELSKVSPQVAKEYIIYRYQRNVARDSKSALTQIYMNLTSKKSSDMDLKRENANINSDTAMGMMLKFGAEASKEFCLNHLIKPKYARMHRNGDIHIHDLDFYPMTFNCSFIPLGKLLKRGFSTGHGHIGEPQTIMCASSLACIILQANQNEMYGGQAYSCWDYDLAPYVAKSYVKILNRLVSTKVEHEVKLNLDGLYEKEGTLFSEVSQGTIMKEVLKYTEHVEYIMKEARELLYKEVRQAMQASIHNFNTLQSRCLPSDEKVLTLNVKKSKDVDKLSDTEREAFKDLIENLYSSMTIKEVAAELNIGCKVMHNLFNKLGVKIRNKKETAEFMKTRWIEKYGVDNPSKNPEILKKIRNTQFKKYGCYCFNTEKQKQTMIERYGVENPMQNEDVKNKLFENNIKKYGCKCTLQVPEVIEKSKKTCTEKYGVPNVLCKNSPLRPSNIGFDKNPESNVKAHKTLQEKYGGSGSGSQVIREKIASTCMKKYGHVTYPVYKDAYGLHESKGQIELYNTIKNKYPGVAVIKNQRGLLLENKGLEIDIWIPQLRIGIEYNGDYWHDRNTYEDDIINNNVTTRERIKDILAANNNITLIQIWESDFKSNKKDVLDYIFSIIDEHLED